MRSGPARSQCELRALIHAANVARDAGLASVPGPGGPPVHLPLFCYGVACGACRRCLRVPGGNKKAAARPLPLLECLKGP